MLAYGASSFMKKKRTEQGRVAPTVGTKFIRKHSIEKMKLTWNIGLPSLFALDSKLPGTER